MFTLASSVSHEIVVKKSRFIVHAFRADTPDMALSHLAEVRQPDATHHCWAYKIDSTYRFSDDGEPGGTAGRPILAAIEGQQFDHVMVVVIRYFGGIKLGTGGLVRAYGGAAAQCLRLGERVEIELRKQLEVQFSFDDVGRVYPVLDRFDVLKSKEEFHPEGVTLHVEMSEGVVEAFTAALNDATRGMVRVTIIEAGQG